MKMTAKRIAASVMAVASLAVGMVGMSAGAYSDSASMVLRNVSGAPGNVTSGTLTINTKSSNSYYTSYDFANSTSTTLYVASTNAISNKNVTLSKSKKAATISSVQGRYSYITFSGSLSNSAGESGIWSMS